METIFDTDIRIGPIKAMWPAVNLRTLDYFKGELHPRLKLSNNFLRNSVSILKQIV